MSDKATLEKDIANCKISLEEILRNPRVHEINQGRAVFGEYHHLFPILKKHEDRFAEYMRMRRCTFDYILSHIEHRLEKNWCNLHSQAICPEEQLVVTIRFLATGMTYNDLAFTFRMGKSTICDLVRNTMLALWEILYPKHMPVPSIERWLQIAQEFYEIHNYPHCLGAIDVRHIWIKKPKDAGSMYWNFKNFNSIPLQAVVDARGKYISIDVGGHGSQHDAKTLRASSFYEGLMKKIVKIPEASKLPGTDIVAPYFFIADCVYPLLENLMKPYMGRNLTENQKNFNSFLSGTRRIVECCFGQDCQRWRIYYKQIECLPETVHLIAKTTCVLHNVIIDLEKIDIGEKNVQNTPTHADGSKALASVKMPEEKYADVGSGFSVDKGREIREILEAYFATRQHNKNI